MQPFQAFGDGVHVTLGFLDRLAERLEVLGGGVGALNELLVAMALLRHLLEDGAHLFGDLLVFGAFPE